MIENYTYKHMEVSVFQAAKKGNNCCGDSYFMIETPKYFVCALADGLGSGEAAKKASATSIKVVEENYNKSLDVLMGMCNEKLRATRGSVVSLIKMHYDNRVMEYCSVGNINTFLVSPSGKCKQPIPEPGFLVGRKKKFHVKQIKFDEDVTIISFSDGVRFTTKECRELSHREKPSSAVLHIAERHIEPTDDITCFIGKLTS